MSFSMWRQRLGRLRFTLTVALVAGLCVWLGYVLGNTRLSWLESEYAGQQARIERLQRTIEQLEYRVNILRVELDVERVATDILQDDLRLAQEENAAILRELTFYQRVVAPDLAAEGVTIDSLVINTSGAGLHYFRLILLQVERAQQDMTQGQVELIMRGRRDGESIEYNLFELAGMDETGRSFSMNYFARLDGSFMMPEGVRPETVTVRVRTRAGDETEQVFPWSELVDAVDEPLPVGENESNLNVGR